MLATLAKSSSHYIIGTFATYALSFIRVPILTRLVSVSDYGDVATFVAYSAILTTVLGLGVPGAIARQVIEEDGRAPQFHLAALVSVASLFAFALVAGLGLVFTRADSLGLTDFVIAALLLESVANVFFEIARHYWQIKKRSGRYAVISFLAAATNLLLTLALLFLTDLANSTAIITAIVSAKVLFALITVPVLFEIGYARPTISDFKALWSFGLPLVPHMLSMNLLVSFDRIAIRSILGSEATGLYSSAYNVGLAVSGVLFGIATAFSPLFYGYMKNSDKKSLDSLHFASRLAGWSIAMLSVGFLPLLSFFLLGPSFQSAIYLVPLVVVGYFFHFNYFPYSSFQYYHQKTRAIATNTILAVTSNVVGNIILIPVLGLDAAAFTTVFSYFLLFFLNYRSAKQQTKQWLFLSIRFAHAAELLTLLVAAIAAYALLSKSSQPIGFIATLVAAAGFVAVSIRVFILDRTTLWDLWKQRNA